MMGSVGEDDRAGDVQKVEADKGGDDERAFDRLGQQYGPDGHDRKHDREDHEDRKRRFGVVFVTLEDGSDAAGPQDKRSRLRAGLDGGERGGGAATTTTRADSRNGVPALRAIRRMTARIGAPSRSAIGK
jgi:hypothetical protein